MGKWTVLALRVVLGLLFVGSLVLLLVMVPVLANDIHVDESEISPWQPKTLIATLVLGILASQVILVSVWKLVTLVRRGSVFSHASFRYVDVITGAIAFGGALVFAMACVLAPGEAAAPGVVLIICGVSLAIFGVALVTLVMRALLGQAVALDVEAKHLQSELDEVI
jgi:Protein of unknown function (DUF2975)